MNLSTITDSPSGIRIPGTLYALDLPGMGHSEIVPGEPKPIMRAMLRGDTGHFITLERPDVPADLLNRLAR